MSMSRRFAYIYFMKPLEGPIRETVPLHVEYWRSRNLAGYIGGPFADRSGGLITFEAANAEEAAATVEADPFIARGVIETRWLKEWAPE
jgi:uncharacterized protein YciI